ncbi:MAG TPA: EamA family transporter, partial [Trebonia sp.]
MALADRVINQQRIPLRGWIALVLGLAGIAVIARPPASCPVTCYVIALRRLPTPVVSTYAYVNPVVAVALGALLLGERPTPATLLGGAVVV